MPQRCNKVGASPILRVWYPYSVTRPVSGLIELFSEEMRERTVGIERPAERIVWAELEGNLKLVDRLHALRISCERSDTRNTHRCPDGRSSGNRVGSKSYPAGRERDGAIADGPPDPCKVRRAFPRHAAWRAAD